VGEFFLDHSRSRRLRCGLAMEGKEGPIRRAKLAENEMNGSMDSPATSNGISTFELTKSYRDFRAVDSLNLKVDGGEVFGFLGPNGAGKTTTIRMLCGLLAPTAGRAQVAGFDVRKNSLKVRAIIGLLPESSGFYNWMNAEEYLLHFASLYKIDKQEATKRSNDLLERVGLADKSFAPIGYYSRGMKQRLALARTLINEPRIIFLDEPTLGLDPKGQQDIRRMLREINDAGVTVFLSSHALSEVSSLCNRVAIVDHGRLIAQGTIDELRKLAGGSQSLLVRVVNSESARQRISALPYQAKTSTHKVEDAFIEVEVREGSDSVSEIIHAFEKQGFAIYEIRRQEMTLEQVFFNLTEAKANDGKGERGQGTPADAASSGVE
jgi:ABC-2 type transport system ATP-binding protein